MKQDKITKEEEAIANAIMTRDEYNCLYKLVELHKQKKVNVVVVNEYLTLNRCPNCSTSTGFEQQKYCNHCGQKLKWSEQALTQKALANTEGIKAPTRESIIERLNEYYNVVWTELRKTGDNKYLVDNELFVICQIEDGMIMTSTRLPIDLPIDILRYFKSLE